MARKVIGLAKNAYGRRGSTRRRWALLLSLVMVVAAGAVYRYSVLQAQIFINFELDKNAVEVGATPGEDWSTIYAAHLNPASPTLANAFSFVADGEGPTIFTGGASKDDLDIPGWQHKEGSTPPKDELLNGYAARYGDFLYFGADRYSGVGSAQMGIWFFQNEVLASAGGVFTGQHKDGDILVLSDFTQGGAQTTIRVFKWNGPDPNGCTQQQEDDGECLMGVGDINGTLTLVAGDENTSADCAVVGPTSPFCATVNTTEVASPWTFIGKDSKGVDTGIPAGQFYEGGIDLGFLGAESECFASFLIETRSSPSVDATLKDFVGGGFEECTSSLVTTPVANNTSTTAVPSITLGQSINDYALLTGGGGTTAPTGNITFFICEPTELTPTLTGICDDGDGTQVGSPMALVAKAGTPPSAEAWSEAYTPDVVGRHCFRATYPGDGNYPAAADSSAGECFEVLTLAATISTAQTWKVRDSATISVGDAGTTLKGTVKFELFSTSNCTGADIGGTDDDAVAVTGASPVTVLSSEYTVSSTPGTYPLSWKATYTSGLTAHRNVTHGCVETASLTYANGSTTTSP